MQQTMRELGEAAERGARPATPADEAPWPFADARRIVFLLDAATSLERRLLQQWIARNRPERLSPSHCETMSIPSSRRSTARRLDPRLEAALATDDDPLLAPLRVAWFPREKDGAARLSHLATLGDPRDPGWLRQRWLARRQPDRARVVVAEPALLSDLRERWRRTCGTDFSQTTGLAEFVARQAAFALERAERRLRGSRYKIPRFVHEEILGRPAFRGGVARLARELGRAEPEIAREASGYLKEIAATHSRFVIDLAAHLIRLLYTQGYGERLHYDREQLREIYTLAQRYPVVFLPSHKSNLDHLVLQYALYENGHPPNHTAGGINMNFLPVGPIVRRSGVFFIRRTFKDNAVYKFVLRRYIDYLVEKRFPLEWYVEGGRSRSGKMLPPRFGLLAYVTDAYRRGKSEDVLLIPVSIAYDQIQDVGDYVAEQRGAAKQRESFGWFLRVLRQLRRRYGDIHIRFGDPLSLLKALGPPDMRGDVEADEHGLDVQKLAFEVAVRINRATPITPTSLVTLALLGIGERAVTVEETAAVLRNWLRYVKQRRLPATEDDLGLDTTEGVRRALAALVDSGVVSCFAEGPEAVYRIDPDQHLTAAYYRNTIIHFFVNGAIAELALLDTAEADGGDRLERFWQAAVELRDLLKFEFFFADKDAFREEIRREIAFHDPEWESRVPGGAEEIQGLLRRFRPFMAHRVLRPFLEAYQVVGDALARRDPAAPLDESRFLVDCLGLGRQYHLQRRIRSGESVSKVLFETALRLAKNRSLTAPGGADLAERRRAFANQIRDAVRRVDAVDALAASRRAGLID